LFYTHISHSQFDENGFSFVLYILSCEIINIFLTIKNTWRRALKQEKTQNINNQEKERKGCRETAQLEFSTKD